MGPQYNYDVTNDVIDTSAVQSSIELSINKQSVTSDCVIIYKFPAFCKQTPWRIQRSNKEVSMQIITQNVILDYQKPIWIRIMIGTFIMTYC